METKNSNGDWFEHFQKNGYAVIESFATESECDELKEAIHKVTDSLDVEKEHRITFSTRGQQQHISDDYFLTSGDKIRYFFEKLAFNEEGDLVVPKDQSLNKIGHALHWHNEVFRSISFSDKMKSVAKTLGLVDPAIIQSMYIFKNPRVGAEVCPHQDSSFLHMEPMKLFGVWLAVDDATEENGCLHFIPGSHLTDGLYGNRRMLRYTKEDGHIGLKLTGEIPEMESTLYKPVPVKKGSLVIIHGMVMHKSEPNKSANPRNAYTLHLIEQQDTKWSDLNWLQPTDDLPFTPLYTN